LRQRAAASPNGGTPPGQQRQRQQQQQQHDEEAHLRFDGGQNGAAEPATPATAADGAAAITLHYASGWRAPTMLYSLQGGDWDSCELAEVRSRALAVWIDRWITRPPKASLQTHPSPSWH